jgi:ribose 5-phosphate isomerase
MRYFCHDDLITLAHQTVCAIPSDCHVLGVGSGKTVDAFITVLAHHFPMHVHTIIAASHHSYQQLTQHNLPVVLFSEARMVDVFIDGADRVLSNGLLKGMGGALTCEKILHHCAKQTWIMGTSSKWTNQHRIIIVEIIPALAHWLPIMLPLWNPQPYEQLSDHGLPLWQLTWPTSLSLPAAATILDKLPGMVAHGIFIL